MAAMPLSMCWAAADAPAKSATPPAPAVASPGTAAKRREPRIIDWQQLLPDSERDAVFPPIASHDYLGESGPAMDQVGSSKTNPKVNNVYARVPGFIVPVAMDATGMVSEFLLVPYFGACIHVPPPPPNQIVYVKPEKPFRLKTIYEPQWVIGVLKSNVQKTRVASAAYTIAAEKIEPYKY